MSESGDDTPTWTWAAHAASGARVASLTALATATPSALAGPELVDAIVSSEKALSLLTGIQMRLLAAFAEPFVAGDPMRLATRLARKNRVDGDPTPEQVQLLVPEAASSLAAAEVAAALRISPVTAGIRVRDACTMTTTLAPTLRALEVGVLDRSKARVIADHCGPLTSEHTAAVQGLVLPVAAEVTTSELRDIAGQAVITVDPNGAEERHQAARARRDLAMRAMPDAMATLSAFLPADGAVKIFQVSDLLATGTAGSQGDPRGIGARRVDALVDIADHLLTYGHLDLTDFLGNPLPDHGSSSERPPTDESPDRTGGSPHGASGSTSGANRSTTSGDAGSFGDGTTTSEPADIAQSSAVPDVASAHPPIPSTADSHPSDAAIPDRCATDRADDDLNTATPDPSATDLDTLASTEPTPDATRPSTTSIGVPAAGESNCDQSPADAAGGDLAAVPSVASAAKAEDEANSAGVETDRAAAPSGGAQRQRAFSRQGRRPHLAVSIGLGTLAGLDNLPGTLAGFGAIPAGLARSIAMSAATITAQLTNPETGRITHAGDLTYRPRQELRDQIAALLGTCQFPSCRQPVWRCDLDHRDPFDHDHPERGGRTTAENA